MPPSLSTIPEEERLGYLLVFGIRYRKFGATNNPVRADTVDKALLAVGEGISDLDVPDPPKKSEHSDQLHPLLADFLSAMRREDDPQTRAYPVNVTILRSLRDALDLQHPRDGVLNQHVIDLIIVAFFWLLRPAEYTYSQTPEARSQAFLFRHIHLTIDDTIYCAPEAPLNDSNSIGRIRNATLMFDDQKNATRGEQVGHRATNDPFFCPAKALGRIARRLKLAGAPPDTPIYKHYNPRCGYQGWYDVKSSFVTNALRHAAQDCATLTGIAPELLSARSLRPGGATALLCAGVDSSAVQLLGRWKSDTMLRYLHIQAAVCAHHYSQQMLEHGSCTFHPHAPQTPFRTRLRPRSSHSFLDQLL